MQQLGSRIHHRQNAVNHHSRAKGIVHCRTRQARTCFKCVDTCTDLPSAYCGPSINAGLFLLLQAVLQQRSAAAQCQLGRAGAVQHSTLASAAGSLIGGAGVLRCEQATNACICCSAGGPGSSWQQQQSCRSSRGVGPNDHGQGEQEIPISMRLMNIYVHLSSSALGFVCCLSYKHMHACVWRRQ
jgi:hypothetical protein